MGDAAISAKEFEQLAQWIEEACGIKLAPEKAYLVETRLLKLMLLQGCETYGEFYEHLRASRDPALKDKIIDAMTTNETLWFRDSHPFAIFREVMLPRLAERARTGKVRIWSAASSSRPKIGASRRSNMAWPVSCNTTPAKVPATMASRVNLTGKEDGVFAAS